MKQVALNTITLTLYMKHDSGSKVKILRQI